jgi:hypothetical protein
MTELEPAGELHEASSAETGVAPVNTRSTGPACVCRDRLRANGRPVLLGAERGRVADADRPVFDLEHFSEASRGRNHRGRSRMDGVDDL